MTECMATTNEGSESSRRKQMRNKKSRGVAAADTDGHELQDSSRDDVDSDFDAHASAGQPPLIPAKKSNK